MEFKALSVDTTPTNLVQLGGTVATRITDIIAEPLEANIVALRHSGEIFVIVSLDLLYAGAIVRSALAEALSGLDDQHLFVAASHTHSAPMTDDTKPLLGLVSSEYVAELCKTLACSVMRITEDAGWTDGTACAGAGQAAHSINRRLKSSFALRPRPGFNKYRLGPNQAGATDETLLVLVLLNPDASPHAVVWNYACHPVGFPRDDVVAANFPGVVRHALRKQFGLPGLPVLFLQGFSGNTRPSATVYNEGAMASQTQLRRPFFAPMTQQRYSEWAYSLAARVASACIHSRAITGHIDARRNLVTQDRFVSSTAKGVVSFHSLSIGQDFQIVGVSAEVMAEYAEVVRSRQPRRHVMCVGCIDHTFGYAPTTKILSQGGYEAHGFCAPFGLSRVDPQIELQMMAGFQSVMDT